MHRTWKRQLAFLLVSGLAIGLAPAAQADTAAAAQRFSYLGYAYGSTAFVGNNVKVGRSAVSVLGCTTKAGIRHTNTVASVNAKPTITTGNIFTSASSLANPTASRVTSEVHNSNLLGGAIKADTVKSVSTTSRQSGAFKLSAQGTTFLNLVVGGQRIGSTPGPNTRVNLAGLGYAIINQQIKQVTTTSARFTVIGIHVFVTEANNLGVEKGTQIIIANAGSGLAGPVAGLLDGKAYATSVTVGNTVRSGPSALVIVPCEGTKGNVKTNNIISVNVPNIVTVGSGETTAQGTVGASVSTSKTTATVKTANLLNSVVAASLVKAVAQASTNGTTNTFSDAGSGFGSLTVQGHPEIGADVARNTKVTLAGLGTLYLHRVIKTANSIEVRMIELIITESNPQNIPIGTDIRVSVARASVHA